MAVGSSLLVQAMKLLALTLLAFLVPLAESTRCQDLRRAARQFEKDFASSPARPRSVDERHAALEALDGLDGKVIAEALVDAAKDLGVELAALEAERSAMRDEMEDLIRGQEAAERRVLPPEKLARFRELRQQSEATRQQLDDLRELLADLRGALGALESPEALGWLVDHALKDKRLDIAVKLEIARATGAADAVLLADLVEALERARDTGQTLALLDAIAYAGPRAREAAPTIVERLTHDDGRVRERAALALARLGAPEAIEPMIDLLERETGQARKRVGAALEILTGQQHGTNVASWRAWFAAEGAAFLAGEHELGRGRPSRRSDADRGYYFDIPQDGKSTVYVIDASGSMEKEILLRTRTTKTDSGRTSRLEACKGELIRALERLPSDAHFNVVWYNDLPHLFRPTMEAATPRAIDSAQEWVRRLQPASSTNIHDALQMAFSLTGQGARDKYYESAVDTIFLLTDGSPTKPDGSLDSTDKIIRAVREWNPLKRVVIHTIGLGDELNEPFLRALAIENGGEFKRH